MHRQNHHLSQPWSSDTSNIELLIAWPFIYEARPFFIGWSRKGETEKKSPCFQFDLLQWGGPSQSLLCILYCFKTHSGYTSMRFQSVQRPYRSSLHTGNLHAVQTYSKLIAKNTSIWFKSLTSAIWRLRALLWTQVTHVNYFVLLSHITAFCKWFHMIVYCQVSTSDSNIGSHVKMETCNEDL